MLNSALHFFMTIKNKQELPQSVIINLDQNRMIEQVKFTDSPLEKRL